ncbi:MAG: helix-turn-helix domain-containing protein [Bacillota bacterium]
MRTLGDNLRNAREEKNLTQVEVSRKTGIHNKTISNYENNVSSPDPDTLKLFADIYETSVDYLLGRTPLKNAKVTGTDRDGAYVDVSGLPEEAVTKVEEYVELLKLKYGAKKPKKRK